MDWASLVLHGVHDFSGPPTLASMYIAVLSKAAFYAVAFIALWALIVCLLRLLGFGATIGASGARRGTWALKIAMLLHHSVICPLAIIGILQDPSIAFMYSCFGCADSGQVMNRSTQPPLAARALTPITLGYFIADLVLLSQWDLTKSGKAENALMLFHHIASLLVWPAAVYFDWVARYVIIMLSYEFTSLWLVVLWMLSAAGMKKHPMNIVAGLIFTVSFVIMRVLGAFPQLRAMWNAPPWSQEVEHRANPGGIHELCWLYSISLVFPHLLNLYWGVKVVRGFASVAKTAFGGGKKSDKAA
eukprot:TRINITY_DN46556_c0_g1_i1.p1 TRINITY_DN46556_c0_g1~~TRINITY_DN46556_c0_g1_i1.p1  ORF type:complete len:302 (-),score=42.45 TRINITY_DN46556_c0_g1_i1:49-954(-)